MFRRFRGRLLAASTALAAGFLIAPVIGSIGAGPAQAASPWTIVASPNLPGAAQSVLAGVACLGPSNCTAVGYSADAAGSNTRALIETSSGGTWAIVPSPNPTVTDQSELSGVSCVDSSTCIAVGTAYDPAGTTLIESWNGVRWATVPSPNPTGAFGSSLQAISCVTSSRCTAVGYYSDGSNLTLIESWNGHRWSVVPSPDPSTATESMLEGVSCSSRTACTAVGDYEQGDGSETLSLVESWNGITWSIVPSPNPSGAGESLLASVRCLNATDCFAVGSYYEGSWNGLIEQWNGTAWSVVASPVLAGGFGLVSVSCIDPSSCTAVGDHHTGSTLSTLVERWNGEQWLVRPSPNPPGTTESVLSGVSCRHSYGCTAVGFSAQATSDKTLVEIGSQA